MNTFLKVLSIKIISVYYSKRNPIIKISNYIDTLKSYIYSIRCCRLFNCENVFFNRKLNYIKGVEYFHISNGTHFGRLAVLTAWDSYENENFNPEVKIGSNCNFGDYLHLTCINNIIIGNNCLTGRWVTISDNNHGNTDMNDMCIPPINRKLSSKGKIIIGDNVWIGDKATILGGVTIGDGCIIAANSVVTKDIPPFSVAAENPAILIKTVEHE